jgi:hypothetical protein
MFVRTYLGFVRVPLDGGAASWNDTTGGFGRMAVSADAVYITESQAGNVWRFPREGGAPVPVQASLPDPRDIVVSADGTTVYFFVDSAPPAIWTAQGSFAHEMLTLDVGAQPVALVWDHGELFWGDQSNGVVRKLQLTPGAVPVDLARSDPPLVQHLQVEGAYVYWGASDATSTRDGIFKVARCGGAMTLLTVAQSAGAPVRFGIGPEFIYWSRAGKAEVWTSVK